jgi:hypothetical protein
MRIFETLATKSSFEQVPTPWYVKITWTIISHPCVIAEACQDCEKELCSERGQAKERRCRVYTKHPSLPSVWGCPKTKKEIACRVCTSLVLLLQERLYTMSGCRPHVLLTPVQAVSTCTYAIIYTTHANARCTLHCTHSRCSNVLRSMPMLFRRRLYGIACEKQKAVHARFTNVCPHK